MVWNRLVSAPRRVAFGVAAVVVALDALTKALVVHFLTAGGIVHVGGLFELDLYYNHVGARNTLTGDPLAASLLALAAVAAVAAASLHARQAGHAIVTGLLLGGGIGNLLDRLAGAPGPLRGGVIDWLRPPGTTGSMNLADLAITAGIALAIILSAHRLLMTARRVGESSS